MQHQGLPGGERLVARCHHPTPLGRDRRRIEQAEDFVSQGAMQPMRLRPGLVRQGQLSPMGLPAQITQRDLIGEPTVTDGILDDQDDVRYGEAEPRPE